MRFDPSQSDSGPERAIALKPRASRTAALLLLGMTMLGLFSIGLSGLAVLLKAALLALTLLFMIISLTRLIRHRPGQILLNDDCLLITTAAGESLSISDCRRVFLSPWYLGFIGFDDRGPGKFHVALFRDQLDREGYRQLSAWFRRRQQ